MNDLICSASLITAARHRLRRKKAHPQDAFVQRLPIELPRQGRDFYWTQGTALYRREKLAKKNS
jgi:hypothetical protein